MEMLPGRSEIYVLGDEDRQLAVGGPALIAPDGSRHEVPVRVFEALQLVEATLRSGLPVKITALRDELPIDEAADAIDMASDTLRTFVADGKIPFRSGEHVDWVKLADVLAFRQRLQAQRRDALTEMLDEQPWDDDGDGDDTAPSPNPGR